MKKIMLLIMAVFLLVGCSKNQNVEPAATSVEEETPKNHIATVNGKGISIEDFNKYYAMQSYDFEKEFGASVWDIEQDGKTMRQIRQDQTYDYMVRVELVRQYLTGKGEKIDEAVITEAYNKYMASIENDAELNKYFVDNDISNDFIRRFITDQYYLRVYNDQLLEDISNDPKTENLLFNDKFIRYKTRHILLDTQEAVDEVLQLLNDEENPADFSDMARIYSIHSTSAVKGGDLGYILVGNMPEAYEAAALTIEPYTVSEPIQTEYGYHLIFVDDRQMLQDMIDTGMPEEEIDTYKSEIIEKYAANEIVRIFQVMKEKADITPHKELLNGE